MLAGKNKNFYKLALSFLMKVARHAENTQNWKLVNVLQYIKKKSIATAFVLNCDAKYLDTLRGASHVPCYLFLGGGGQKYMWSFREF